MGKRMMTREEELFRKNFGENLKKIRELKEYTQHYVAEQIGSDRRVVSRYEIGSQLPDAYTTWRIALALEVNVESLYSNVLK